eukprot:3093331-Pyramimonas_sp.AAC.2
MRAIQPFNISTRCLASAICGLTSLRTGRPRSRFGASGHAPAICRCHRPMFCNAQRTRHARSAIAWRLPELASS